MTREHKPRAAKLQRPTMADLAQELGISKITISRALSGHPLVRDSTRARIRALAEARGYQINVAARNLRLQRSNTIAVVIEMMPTPSRLMSDSFPLALLGGIIQELAEAGISAMLSTVDNFMKLPPAVDGVILLGQGVFNDAVETLADYGLPLVVWGSVRGGAGKVVVGSDNLSGGALAAQRLAQLGRRHLVFLGDIAHAEIADRFEGFRDHVQLDGGELIAQASCAFTFAGGHDAMIALLAEHDGRIDGVFAASDMIAMGAVRALTEMGKAVPTQVSVIGFDDTASAAFFVPPLTTVRQNWHEGGRLLARKALALIDGHSSPSETLPVSLIVRNS